MASVVRPALTSMLVLTLLTGIVYPIVVTGAACLVFPRQARGSLLVRDGRILGADLIGQPFSAPGYFWGRPSATAPQPYNANASTGSNLGPSNPALADAIRDRVAALRAADPTQAAPIPVDLVTTSASGLDPDISPAAALYQAGRVAHARGLEEDSVRALVKQHIRPRTFGIFGEPAVNVLQLNLSLDQRVVEGAMGR